MAFPTPNSVARRNELLHRYQQGNLTYQEAMELQQLLTQQAVQLKSQNDLAAAAAILVFLVALAAFIALLAGALDE